MLTPRLLILEDCFFLARSSTTRPIILSLSWARSSHYAAERSLCSCTMSRCKMRWELAEAATWSRQKGKCKIADFQPYNNLLELVHQATKAERQVQDDIKFSKYAAYSLRNVSTNSQDPPSAAPYTRATPSMMVVLQAPRRHLKVHCFPNGIFVLMTIGLVRTNAGYQVYQRTLVSVFVYGLGWPSISKRERRRFSEDSKVFGFIWVIRQPHY